MLPVEFTEPELGESIPGLLKGLQIQALTGEGEGVRGGEGAKSYDGRANTTEGA